MIIIYGEKAYGKVDRVPGLCYVVTMFAHLNFIPLFPLRSYIVIAGTEDGSAFRGKEIGISLKSMAAGYARVWFGAVAVVAGAIAGFGLAGKAAAVGVSEAVTIGLIAAGIGGVLTLFVGGKAGAGIQAGVHLLSLVMFLVFSSAAGGNRAGGSVQEHLFALGLANVALLIFGLTRLLDHAGPDRARELMQQLGVEVPSDDDEPRDSKWEDWDASEDRRRR